MGVVEGEARIQEEGRLTGSLSANIFSLQEPMSCLPKT
jgi:hypothetical protein